MKISDFIFHIMTTYEIPEFNRLKPDYEYGTVELETKDHEIFVMTITKKTSIIQEMVK